jgi:hypothetical protein
MLAGGPRKEGACAGWSGEALNGPLDGGAKIQMIRALQVALEKAGVSLG